jgi:hypothetical protein
MTGFSRIAEALRQRGHHAAFRIGPPVWDDERWRQLTGLVDDTVGTINDAFAAIARERVAGAGSVSQDRGQDGEQALDARALAGAGTSLWRARGKLTQLKDDSRQARQTNRYLGETEAALAKAGLTIQDHTGDIYHSGLALEVVVMVEDPNVSEETIVETVRPSIYFDDRRIQEGQIVVGRPPRQAEAAEAAQPAQAAQPAPSAQPAPAAAHDQEDPRA